MSTVVATLNGRRAFVRTIWVPELKVYQLKVNGLPHVEFESDVLQFVQQHAIVLAHGVQLNG